MQNEEKRTYDVIGYSEEDKIRLNEIRCDEIVIEINAIRRQTAAQVLFAAVDIGRLLCEAKDKLPHGEWGPWLQDNFKLSQSSANNYMKLYRNYGDGDGEQIEMFFQTECKMDIFGNLTPSQAIALLGMPERERAEYVQTHDMENTSVSEIEREVKARKEAEARAQEISERLAEAEAAAEEARASAQEAEELRRQLESAEAALESEKQNALKLKDKLKMAKENPKIPADKFEQIQKEAEESARKVAEAENGKALAEARKKADDAEKARVAAERAERDALARLEAAHEKLKVADPDVTEFKTLFESVQDTVAKLRGVIDRIRGGAPETADKLSNALHAFGASL